MVSIKILFGSVLVFWLCSTGLSVFVFSDPSAPSYVLGGNPNYDTKNDNYGMNCGQFKDDFDILRQFPYRIRVDPRDDDEDFDVVQLNQDNRTVRMMFIIMEKFLPSSVFCLSNISDLTLSRIHFKDNVLPEGIKQMQTLTELSISNVPNLKIGDHFIRMPKLRSLGFRSCALTTFPDISHLKMNSLSLNDNNLTHLSGPIDVHLLSIDDNYFQSLPILKNPENIVLLSASNNPIENITPILEYKNLESLFISQTNITFVPHTIDRLQKLRDIDFSETKITRLPPTILNLPQLEYLNIKDTLLSPMQIQSIRKAFKISHPNLRLEA